MDATMGMSLAILFHHIATAWAARLLLQVSGWEVPGSFNPITFLPSTALPPHGLPASCCRCVWGGGGTRCGGGGKA
eukprot:1136670-Pelagomonas_calceolata.AAC.3